MTSRFTLYDLHQYIRRIFYLNFEEKIWVEAEIAESRYHNGHFYFSFVEKNEDGELMAKASGALWRSKVPSLRYRLKDRRSEERRVGKECRSGRRRAECRESERSDSSEAGADRRERLWTTD